MIENSLFDPLSNIVSNNTKLKQFHKKDLYTIKDLLDYLPKDYNDYTTLYTARNLLSFLGTNKKFAIKGTVINSSVNRAACLVRCKDAHGNLFSASFFNQQYLASKFIIGKSYVFAGEIKEGYGSCIISIIADIYSDNAEDIQKIYPVYKKIEGMSDGYLIETINTANNYVKSAEALSKEEKDVFKLIGRLEAYEKIHNPKSFIDIQEANKRITYDIFSEFALNVENTYKNSNDSCYPLISENYSYMNSIINGLSFDLTQDQQSVLSNILLRLKTSNSPLNALIQGDVGSGKTIVALLLCACAAENHLQSCFVAPTEVLARQHYLEAVKIFSAVPGINIQLITGSAKAKEKRDIYTGIKSGSIDILIGTHAAFQDSIEFGKLGILIIDEQHKFGVEQRESLFHRSDTKPHVIAMTATPIPRTLSMAIFGSLIQVYNIKTKPSNRKPIKTGIMSNSKQIYSFMHKEIQKGHQAYIICPMIDDNSFSKKNEIDSTEKTLTEVSNYFKNYPEIKYECINGKMKKNEIDEIMSKMKNNEIQILISTTIVEVGVNIPNATVILLKNSDRFGLAQAHQLRGRVGRSDIQSYCILQTSKDDLKSNILCSTTDGFVLAEKDLELRKSGDYFGTKQSGSNKEIDLIFRYPKFYNSVKNYVIAKSICD